jgi:hypothetical protein
VRRPPAISASAHRYPLPLQDGVWARICGPSLVKKSTKSAPVHSGKAAAEARSKLTPVSVPEVELLPVAVTDAEAVTELDGLCST